MSVAVIGSGGREHAISWAISKSISKIFIIPGNAGTSQIGENVNINPLDFPNLINFLKKNNINEVIVGPENPIAEGIKNVLEKENIKVFAPSKEASILEASKTWARIFMKKYQIPHPNFEYFSNFEKAISSLKNKKFPIVIKADGLCGGKGTFIAKNKKEAENIIEELLKNKKFGKASEKIVIEEFLKGEEISIFVVSVGKIWKYLGSARDYKRLLDGDKGPNTGGMGSFSPSPLAKGKILEKIFEKIVEKTFYGLEKEGLKYEGVLYFGLMISEGEPYVLEYNVRLGDPETQVVLPLLETKFYEIVKSVFNKDLKSLEIKRKKAYAVDVVIASQGYPFKYEKNKEIKGLEKVKDVLVFHAGTKKENNKILTTGGRVLNIVGISQNLKEAREKVYKEIGKIYFEGMYYRKDIGIV